MQEIIEAIKDTPIPTLLIMVGLIFILLGIVTKLHIIEVQSQQRLWAILLGIFILVIGLILNYSTTQELDKIEGNDSSSNDIVFYPDTSEKDCIKHCKDTKKDTKRCVAVVISPQDECWLKSKINYPLSINQSRTIIKIR